MDQSVMVDENNVGVTVMIIFIVVIVAIIAVAIISLARYREIGDEKEKKMREKGKPVQPLYDTNF